MSTRSKTGKSGSKASARPQGAKRAPTAGTKKAVRPGAPMHAAPAASPPERRDDRPEAVELLANIHAALPRLEELRDEVSSHWGYEDPVYRFYHQSWKVYYAQDATTEIVETLRALSPQRSPERELNEWFLAIVHSGTGKTFERSHNERWLEVTRPMLEAFFHARYFLEMVCKYGRELEHPPASLPSGWAAVLYLYGMR